MGRKPAGVGLVDQLPGSELAKKRLRAVLETIQGTADIEAACEALGIQRSRFLELRHDVLCSMVAKLEPRPAGRPRKQTEDVSELEQLRAERDQLLARAKLAEVHRELQDLLVLRQKKTKP